jgi:hypothetical protein
MVRFMAGTRDFLGSIMFGLSLGPSSLLFGRYWGISGQGMKLASPFHLVPRRNMSEALHLFPRIQGNCSYTYLPFTLFVEGRWKVQVKLRKISMINLLDLLVHPVS